jgi:hypothetical protein
MHDGLPDLKLLLATDHAGQLPANDAWQNSLE